MRHQRLAGKSSCENGIINCARRSVSNGTRKPGPGLGKRPTANEKKSQRKGGDPRSLRRTNRDNQEKKGQATLPFSGSRRKDGGIRGVAVSTLECWKMSLAENLQSQGTQNKIKKAAQVLSRPTSGSQASKGGDDALGPKIKVGIIVVS